MAEAIIKGILDAGLVDAPQVVVAELSRDRRDHLRERYGVTVHDKLASVWECGMIVLAVKPQVIAAVLEESRSLAGKEHLVISIAAGIPLAVLEAKLAGSDCRIIRVMPNTPAIVLEGASALSPGSRVTEEDMRAAGSIFDAIGKSVVVAESYLDAVTGLSGSGPAYVFSFIEALIDAGIKVGLDRSIAETLVMQTVLGSVKLAMSSGDHPAQLRAMVTSPGGTTIAGLHELEKSGFQGIIMDAVEAAAHRSQELGKCVATGATQK